MRSSTPYLVCATPRSGSTLLCETLRATGVAGRPLEHFEVLRHSGRPRQPREYFAEIADRRPIERLMPLRAPAPEPEPAVAWWTRVHDAGATPNGVWGGKLMWGHVASFVGRAREAGAVADGAGLRDAVEALLGDAVRFVHVTRPDKVAQAVSLWKAVQTQAWRADEPGSSWRAEYDFAAIDHLVGQLAQQDEAWRAWFAAERIEPLEVAYEELAANPRGTVARVLRFVGLPGADVPAPSIRHQRDARSREWAERYASERRERAA